MNFGVNNVTIQKRPMQTIYILLILLAAYLLGSIPFGLIIVKIGTGKDVRSIGSGRTGGTNVMRAAGLIAGALTAIFDFGKAALSVELARMYAPGLPWVEVAAGLLVMIGHNYSIYLPERTPNGGWRLRGGAGGVACLGGAFGIWHPALFYILPLGALVFIVIGYASLTTISAAFFALVVFTYRAVVGASPWAYAAYGFVALLIVLWALRPNLKRLRDGNERPVGLRAYFLKKTGKEIPWK
jgi:acyl phosphate:glycerol-3-phosphate acyltransferase